MKKIIHIDMDAFYSSIEQRDFPSLRGKPVIVGGDPRGRGVVATCSYEARKFGVHSAMPSRKAFEKCPDAIFCRPRMEVYKKVSLEILEIFYEVTDLVEPLSLDEAYLDVTKNKKNFSSATLLAKSVQEEILKKTHLTASAGVSFNKFLAKVASGKNKPSGLTVVRPSDAENFMKKLSISDFYGVGEVTKKKFFSAGIFTGKELKGADLEFLIKLLGKRGEYYYKIIRGVGDTEVNPLRERRSLGKERTVERDLEDFKDCFPVLEKIAEDLEDLLKRKQLRGKTLTLKVTFFDFKKITRSISQKEPFYTKEEIFSQAQTLLTKVDKKKIRLLGITMSQFQIPEYTQLTFDF